MDWRLLGVVSLLASTALLPNSYVKCVHRALANLSGSYGCIGYVNVNCGIF